MTGILNEREVAQHLLESDDLTWNKLCDSQSDDLGDRTHVCDDSSHFVARQAIRQPDKKHFKEIPAAKRFETPYRSPPGWLWELDDTMWKMAKRLLDYAPRKRRKKTTLLQLSLLEEPSASKA